MSNKNDKIITSVSETYTLPSKGKFYGKDYPEEVTIRSMTTFEEKMRLGSQGFMRTMCNLLNAVVTEPEDFNAEDLLIFDFYFLMYKMRVVSYGPEYRVTVTCPKCGKKSVIKVNLDELGVNYLPDDAVEPFKIGPLPRSKDIVNARHLRVRDIIENERKAKNILDKSPEYIGDPNYILNLASEISSVEGRDLTIGMEFYVENMPAMDSAYFRQKYDEQVEGYGLSTDCEGTCSSCNEELVFSLPFNGEFFRPTFD